MLKTWKKSAGKSILLNKLGASAKKNVAEKNAPRATTNMSAQERMDYFLSEPTPKEFNSVRFSNSSPETSRSPEVDQVLSNLTDTKEKRIKSAIRDSMMKIKERVRIVIQNSGEDEDDDARAAAVANRVRADALKEKLARIEEQKAVLSQIDDFVEDCANRFSLLKEVNEWLWKDHTLQGFQQELEDQLSQTMIENEIDFEENSGMMATFENKMVRMITLICKLMAETGLFQRDPKKANEKVQIFEENSLLKSSDKWDSAIDNISSTFEDAIRWLKMPSDKTTVRNGLRQFRQLLQAVTKRNSFFMDSKRQVADLKKKVETTRLSKEKMEKEAERMGKKVLMLSEQITELKTQVVETDQVNLNSEKSKMLMEERVKDLDARLKDKEREATELTGRVKKLEEELLKAQQALQTRAASNMQNQQDQSRQRGQGYDTSVQYPNYRASLQRRPPGHSGQQQGQQDAYPDQPSQVPQGQPAEQPPPRRNSKPNGEAWPSPFDDEEDDFVDYKPPRREQGEDDMHGTERPMERIEDEEEMDYEDSGHMLNPSPNEKPMEEFVEDEEYIEMMKAPLPPPPEIDIELYYKNIIAGMKQTFQAQLFKYQNMQNRVTFLPAPRTEAERKRYERIHKDNLPSIQKEATHIFRTLEVFTESVSGILTTEKLKDSLVELQKLSGIVSSQMTMTDPLKLLTQMTNRIEDYLQKVVDILSGAFLSMRLRSTAATTVAKETPVHMKSLQHQLDNMEEAKQETMKAFYSLAQLRDHLRGTALKSLQKEINVNPEELAHKDTKYTALMRRYKCVWTMYDRLENEVEFLNVDFEDMLDNKLPEKEELLIQRMQMALKEKKDVEPNDFLLSIQDLQKNLDLLDRAFEENKISKKLYSISLDIVHHALSLPEERVKIFLQKYVAFRAYKDVVMELEMEINGKKTDHTRRRKLIEFRKRMKKRYKKYQTAWKKKFKSYDIEKNNVFNSLWQIFNTVLQETGFLLHHPLLRDKPRLLPPIQGSDDDKRRITSPFIFLSRHRCPKLPKYLLGERVRLFGNRGLGRLPNIHISSGGDKPTIDCPHIIHLDINKSRILAQRTLEKIARQPMKLTVTQGYSVNAGEVSYLNNQVLRVLP